jgi:type I restriction enzyme R subunit
LERVRQQLRELVKFIDKVARKVVYTNFEDEDGPETIVDLPIGTGSQSYERFKEKVRHFLRPRESELPIQKLRLGLGLTQEDLTSLDQMLIDASLGPEDNYEAARTEGLGIFIRSLVGLDRQAAMKAFESFLKGKALSANQQEFVAMIIEELTRTGVMQPVRLYESPFVDLAPAGPESIFSATDSASIKSILTDIWKRASELVPG